jgi:hypothetical protein
VNLVATPEWVVHGGIFSHPTLIVSQALDSLEAYRSANSSQGICLEAILTSNLRLQAPLEGFVKVNLDATADKNNQKMDIGAIIQDFEGEVLAILFALKDHITN